MFRGMALGIVLTLAVALISAYSQVRSTLIPTNADANPVGWKPKWPVLRYMRR